MKSKKQKKRKLQRERSREMFAQSSDKIRNKEELRRSSAASPHGVKRPRGILERKAIQEQGD